MVNYAGGMPAAAVAVGLLSNVVLAALIKAKTACLTVACSVLHHAAAAAEHCTSGADGGARAARPRYIGS